MLKEFKIVSISIDYRTKELPEKFYSNNHIFIEKLDTFNNKNIAVSLCPDFLHGIRKNEDNEIGNLFSFQELDETYKRLDNKNVCVNCLSELEKNKNQYFESFWIIENNKPRQFFFNKTRNNIRHISVRNTLTDENLVIHPDWVFESELKVKKYLYKESKLCKR